MQKLLNIDTRDLGDRQLDYDVVDLGTDNFKGETVNLESSDLENIGIAGSRITALEQYVNELASYGTIRYDTAQELTEEQQAQARENIDAQESISDLDEIRSNAASGASKVSNIQSDWNATTGDAAILNKPNLSNVATSGNYNDLSNKPSIPSQLSDLSSDSTHRLVSDAEKSTWNNKQDAIDDLEDIRENASAGATALQSEEDPVFSASAASGITAEDIASWNEHTSNIGTITGVSVNGTSVATSGVANISSVPASILEGTVPNGITAITQNQGDGSNKIATTSYVDTAINNLPDPMIFRGSLGTGGTITTLPSAASTNVGYTYKVIEDGTYANQSAKIGDTFISDGSAWILIPSGDEPSGTVTSIKIEANNPIQIDNDAAISTSGTRILSHATSGVTAGTYRAVTVNNTGHVTAGTTEAIYILTTNWNSTATQCYLRSQYFLNSLVPTQKGDLILCRGNGNLFKCGDLVYDSQEEVYYTNPTYLCNVLVAQGTSSQFIKGDGSLDSNTYAGAQTSGGAANKAVSIPFGQVDSTSTSTAFTATVDGITELRDGVCVYLKNGVVTSAANCTLNVNGLGAKPIYHTMAATSAVTTQWNISYTMLFVYNSTRMDGGCWDMFLGYYSDANTIGFYLRANSYTLPASDTSRYYKIFFTSADNTKWVPASADSTNNATSARPVNQRPINPFGAIVCTSATTNYTAGTNIAVASLWQQYPLTLGYSFNRTGAALTLTTSKPVFIKCAPQNDGSAIIDANTPYVQDLPTTEDGKIYIFLGVAYSATQVELQMVHPVYHYKNGAINLWTGIGTQTDVSKSTESNVIDVGGYDLMKINEVKGKSLVMNQLVTNGNFVNTDNWTAYSIGTRISVDDGIMTATNSTDTNFFGFGRNISVIKDHKYYFSMWAKASINNFPVYNPYTSKCFVTNNAEIGTNWQFLSSIKTATTTDSPIVGLRKYQATSSGESRSLYAKNFRIFDLTQMFGAGNEPTTVEEVEAILGNDYYEYNTGEVVGNNVEKLDVTGFNMLRLTGRTEYATAKYPTNKWDFLSEDVVIKGMAANAYISSGTIDSYSISKESVTVKTSTSGNASSYGLGFPVKVLPNTSYYFKTDLTSGAQISLSWFDNDGYFISYQGSVNNKTFTSPANAHWGVLIFKPYAIDTEATFTNSVFNVSDTVKNGTYEPYKHSEFPLNLTELTGKVNGEGTSVTIFPDGLHGVGTAYDSLIVDEDGYARRAVKRMAKVDIGTFTWKTTSTESRFYASLPADATVYTAINNVFKNTYFCDKYTKSTTLTGMTDKTTFLGNSSYIYAQDSSYSTAADFKTAMDGVMLYYELATPIEYVLDTPVQCVAKVYPNGTVKQVPVMPDSTPIVMDVTYLKDNGGMIGGLMNRLDSLEARIAALEGG